MCAACLDTEIRKLKPAELYTLGNILLFSDSWKKLMALVVKHGNVPRFNNDDISMIEQTASKEKRNAAQMFLDEWSTMGKKRPTLRLLLELLIKAELFRAADYVACDILKQEKPKRPDYGPAAPVDVSDIIVNQLLREQHVHKQNVLADSLLLGSASELISEINIPCDNVLNDKNEIVNANLLDTANSFCNYKKPTDILSETAANLRNCSVTDKTVNNTDKTENKTCAEDVFASADGFKSGEIQKDTDGLEKPDIADQHYQYKEVSSQELPIFVNNPKQSAAVFDEEMCSSDIPLCLNQ